MQLSIFKLLLAMKSTLTPLIFQALLVTLMAALLPASVSAVVVPDAPAVAARAYILQDFHSGRILAESNADEKMEPASLTKMMTTYVTFSELEQGRIKLADKVRITEKAWRMSGSKMFIEVDTEVSVEALINGVIIQSGNDASVALAEFIAGEELAFADLMNQYADGLGMTGTRFENASGLPAPGHYTTARDMAVLAVALIRDFPEFYPLHALKKYEYNGITQYNRNKLLWRDDTVDGIKTGHTKSAGYCLVASANRDEMRLVSVVLGSKSERNRAAESMALLNYGFRFFETHRIYGALEPLTEIRIWKGETPKLGIGLTEDLYVTVPRGQYSRLDAKMEVESEVLAPVRQGEARGKLHVTLAGEQLVQRPLVALRSVPEGNLWRQVTDQVRLLFR